MSAQRIKLDVLLFILKHPKIWSVHYPAMPGNCTLANVGIACFGEWRYKCRLPRIPEYVSSLQ
jgi:hypothetical protein